MIITIKKLKSSYDASKSHFQQFVRIQINLFQNAISKSVSCVNQKETDVYRVVVF